MRPRTYQTRYDGLTLRVIEILRTELDRNLGQMALTRRRLAGTLCGLSPAQPCKDRGAPCC
jgi:hypothetical protein